MKPDSISTVLRAAKKWVSKNTPPYRDFRFWLIQLVNVIACYEITRIPLHIENHEDFTRLVQNSFALQSFIFLFLISAIASGTIYSLTDTIFTILLMSVFALPRFIAWSIFPFARVISIRFAVISALSIISALIMTRERNARLNMQMLNERMKEVILEKDRFFKLASEAQENERKRIARDLHDDSLQLLATVMQQLDGAISAEEPEKSHAQVVRAKQTITQTSDAIRRYCEALRPLLLDTLGLIPSVLWIGQELEKGTGIKVDFETEGEFRAIRNEDMIHVYRVMQEAFHNIERHSKATAVRVLWDNKEDFEITITDNGIGMWNFGPIPARSLGIQGMYERMELVGGKLKIESQPGFGTKVSLRVPFE